MIYPCRIALRSTIYRSTHYFTSLFAWSNWQICNCNTICKLVCRYVCTIYYRHACYHAYYAIGGAKVAGNCHMWTCLTERQSAIG